MVIDHGWMGAIDWGVQGKLETRGIFDRIRPGMKTEDQGTSGWEQPSDRGELAIGE